jgi:ribosomal-protein-alanine N-acetyltransferase
MTRLLADYVAFCARLTATIRVAERDGEPVGWGARENGDGYISDLWVAPAAQGQGVGTQLLAALEAEIAALGHATASLETRAGAKAAIRFYERNGYRIVWRKLKPTPSLGYAIDKVGMEKPLA